jgi:cytochrome c
VKRLLLALAVFAVGAAGAVVVLVSELGNETPNPILAGQLGDANAGKRAIERYGCGACHTIPGIRSTRKYIGPPLAKFDERRYIAGNQPNTPAELVRWIQNPRAIEPGTVMPKLGVSAREARDIAAYLYADH